MSKITEYTRVNNYDQGDVILIDGTNGTRTLPVEKAGLQLDNTLTQTGKAADAKKTGGKLSELKSDIKLTAAKYTQIANEKSRWRICGIRNDDGMPNTNVDIILSSNVYIDDGIVAFMPLTGYQARLYIYDNTGAYVGYMLSDGTISQESYGTSYIQENVLFDFSVYKYEHSGYKYKIALAKNPTSRVSFEDLNGIALYVFDYSEVQNAAFYTSLNVPLEIGGITGATGENVDSPWRFRTGYLIGDEIVNIKSGGFTYVYGYTEDDVYLGIWDGTEFIKTGITDVCKFGFIDLSTVSGADKYRLCGAPYVDDATTLYVNDLGSIEIYVKTREEINRLRKAESHDFTKIKIAEWNIGHFSLGVYPDTTITEANYATKKTSFISLINELNADILMLAEYSQTFANVSGESISAKTDLFGNYAFSFEGSQIRYSCNAVYANLPIDGLSDTDYECNQDAVITHTTAIMATDYRYAHGTIDINGKTVHIIATHCAFDLNNAQVETDQYAELIELTKDYEHVIILGDMNAVHAASEFDAFVSAGFTLANNGYVGALETYTGSTQIPNRAIDNIMVKGLNMTKIEMVETALSDHNVLMCELSLYV